MRSNNNRAFRTARLDARPYSAIVVSAWSRARCHRSVRRWRSPPPQLSCRPLTGCLHFDVHHLSSDALAGRASTTGGGQAARDFVVERLSSSTAGPVAGATGDAAYLQPFANGTNVIGVIEGSVRPDEYVMVGAHYDGQSTCGNVAGDTLCNSATDNATSASMVLELADRFATSPPERSVVFVLWDAEENGLLGSKYYVEHPIIPLAQTVAYLNLDIQGSNLLPSLRSRTFAIGAESGGTALQSAVTNAYATSSLQPVRVSGVFGQYRSDYAPFLGKQVPTVFFSEATGPCYHTPKDDEFVVDFDKVNQQMNVLHAATEFLARPGTDGSYATPAWTTQPLSTYNDAVELRQVVAQTTPDWGRFPQSVLDGMAPHIANLDRIVADGPAAYDDTDQGQLLNAAGSIVSALTYGDCDGFLP